jgi:hypothetical protein
VPPDPPVPTSATWAGGSAPVYVFFDQALASNPAADTGNWSLRLGGFVHTVTGVNVSPVGVALQHTAGPSLPGPDTVSFDPPPFDVIGANGAPVAAFSTLPVT